MNIKIGITLTKRRMEDYITAVEKAYYNFNLEADIEVISFERASQSLLYSLKGILFTGGGDISPYLYNEVASPHTKNVDRNRDEFEKELLNFALSKTLPVFGICRGMQLINILKGGRLIQDLISKSRHKSNDENSREGVFHKINIQKNTKFYEIFKVDGLEVNSFHHQGFTKECLGKDLITTSYEKTNEVEAVVESIEANDGSTAFLIGVQWHPERMLSYAPEQIKIFEAFLKACAL